MCIIEVAYSEVYNIIYSIVVVYCARVRVMEKVLYLFVFASQPIDVARFACNKVTVCGSSYSPFRVVICLTATADTYSSYPHYVLKCQDAAGHSRCDTSRIKCQTCSFLVPHQSSGFLILTSAVWSVTSRSCL